MLAVSERPASYSEDALAALWSRAHTLADALITESGERLRVIYPGRRSASAGPDFRDAVLLTEDGNVVSGDIELHITAPGWYAHGHDTDPNYNGVVLHVVLLPKGHADTRQQSRMRTPIVSLEATAARLEEADIAAAPALPALDALCGDADIISALDTAGDARFNAKSHGFAIDITQVGADEALYRGIMDALGYASNRKPFRALAQRVPYNALAEVSDEPPATRLLAIKAMLLGASGLMQFAKNEEDIAQLRRIRRRLPRIKPLAKGEWHLFRVRPSNHPVRRIIGAAHLIDGCLANGIVAAFASELMTGGVKTLARLLEHPPHIGRSRARDILVNVALPFLRAHAALRGDDELKSASLEAYIASPRLQENEITREMRRLCGIGKDVKMTARRQQGMIHLYKTAVRGQPIAREPQCGCASAKRFME